MTRKPFNPPKKLMFAQQMSFTLDSLLYNKRRSEKENQDDRFYNPLNRPTICGHVVPDFQRGLCWTDDQNTRLIDSIFRGIPIGTYAINFTTNRLPPRLTNIILDGQQRLNALSLWWDDKIVYRGYRWSELNWTEQGAFNYVVFPQMRTDTEDEIEARTYYNAMNFGGVAHSEEDRA